MTNDLLEKATERLKVFEAQKKHLTLDSLANKDIKETFALIQELTDELKARDK